MSRPMSCTACGIEDYEVRMRLVDLVTEDGLAELELPVTRVSLPAHRMQDPDDTVEAHQRYVREPRCRDRSACRARVVAYETPAPVQPPPAPVEETPAWTI